jgi:hypothetical protein
VTRPIRTDIIGGPNIQEILLADSLTGGVVSYMPKQ